MTLMMELKEQRREGYDEGRIDGRVDNIVNNVRALVTKRGGALMRRLMFSMSRRRIE